MKKIKNVLFSTTKQWNPGDEFILKGTQKLINILLGDQYYNSVIYNRAPQIRPHHYYYNPLFNVHITKNFAFRTTIEPFVHIGFMDNSFKDIHSIEYFDLVVFAGTPEWRTVKLKNFYKKLNTFKGKIVFLGIGSTGREDIKEDKIFAPIFRKAKLITTRDTDTLENLKKFNKNIFKLPCPALISGDTTKDINRVNTVGLIYSSDNSVIFNNVKSDIYKDLMIFYRKFTKYLTAKGIKYYFIAHYIDELMDFYNKGLDKEFKTDIFYNYDSEKYYEIYSMFDFVIGARIHGIGIAASLGIPGIALKHDKRIDTVNGFKAKWFDIKNLKQFDNIINTFNNEIENIKLRNQELKKHKTQTLEQYISLLNKYVK